METVF